jgi:thioredoxin-dependent peroxiredoxin
MTARFCALLVALGVVVCAASATRGSAAADLKVGDPAPLFQLSTQDGKTFDLASRKGKWTVLYFYPKADTPGCTKQACSFRDSIKKVQDQHADVFGVSADSVEKVARFHDKYHLNFTLLADPTLKVIKAYGANVPIVDVAKRWTFIVDPDLKIRSIDRDVNPEKDSERVATELQHLSAPPALNPISP